MDKFAAYFNNEEKIKELSEYVHLNFKLIQAKMVSELRRKLDITPDMENSDGYISLMVSLYGRMFNEFVYGLSGISQSMSVEVSKLIPIDTVKIFLNLYEGKNPLNGLPRTDISDDIEEFKKFYLENVNELRSHKECDPK